MARARRVFLVRHGEVENPTGVVYGRLEGFGLSEAGRAMVEAARLELERVGALDSSIILTSPLQRAVETAEILGASREIVEDARLIEAASPFDGLPRRFAPHLYLRRIVERRFERREPDRAIAARMRDVVLELAAGAHDAIVVSHAAPIQHARMALSGARSIRRPRCALASVTTLEFSSSSELPSISYWCNE